MSTLSIIAWVALIWTALAFVTFLLIWPALALGKRFDDEEAQRQDEYAHLLRPKLRVVK